MSKAKILIVEDNSQFSTLLARLLEKEHYHILAIVSTGELAVEKAFELSPDLILMDIELDGKMNGLDVSQKIHQHIDTPVVYLTGHGDESIIQQAYSIGVYGYIQKPVEPRELFFVIEMALYKHKAEKELIQHRAHLEKLVEKRVKEVKEKNELLEKEIEKREKSESELHRKTESLELLNSINEKKNRGDSLQSIIKFTQEQTKKLFSSYAAQIYFYEKDKNRLVLHYLNIPKKIKAKIEKLLGFSIGEISVSLKSGSLYAKALFSAKTQIINDQDKIQSLMTEFIPDTYSKNSKQFFIIKKVIPSILKIMGIKSVINLLLEADGLKLGLMDISSKNYFTASDIESIEMIAKGIASVLKKKMDEEALLEAETRNRALLTAIPDLIFTFDNKGVFLDYKENGTEHLYSQSNDFIGKNLLEVFPGEIAVPALNCIKQVLQNGQLEDFEYQLTIAGERHYYWARFVLFKERQVLAVIRDITERKNTEQARLRLAAEFQRTIQKLRSQVFRYRKNDKGKYVVTFSEGAIAEQYGITTDKIAGKTVQEIFGDEMWNSISRYYKRVFSGETLQYQMQFNGRWYEIKLSPFERLDDGTVIEIIGINEEITERKKAEEEIVKLSKIAETTSQFIVMTKIDGSVVYVNQAYLEESGYSEEEIIGNSMFDLSSEDGIKILKGKAIPALLSIGHWQGEMTVRRKDSSVFQAELICSLIKSSNEEPQYFVAVFTDITERKEAEQKIQKYREHLEELVSSRTVKLKQSNEKLQQEIAERVRVEEALRRSEEKYRSLFQQSANSILLVDLETMKITDFNEIAHKRLGYTREEFEKLSIADIDAINSPKEIKERIKEIIKKGFAFFETKHITKTGKIRNVKISINYFILNGKPYAQSVIMDITKEKEIEKRLQISEKLAATGRMAAQIAHEINNPLAGIKNSFMLIKDGIPEDYAYYHYAGRIEKEIDRISRITKQMFDIYKPEQISVQTFSLTELIEDVTLLVESDCLEFGLCIELKNPENEIKLHLSESLLKQALFNIIKNAIEASPPKSTITINTKKMNQNAIISITDQGKGIPQEIQQHIFDPFYSSKKTQRKSGLGLGLSVTKELIENIDGTIEFKSMINKGTTFVISIPLKTKDKNN